MTDPRPEPGFRVPTRALVFYVLGTFAITWSIAGSYILFPDRAAALFGPIGGGHPLYFLATWAPALTGIAIVLRFSGGSGLTAFLGRLFLVRGAVGWWLFVLAGIPLIYMAGSLMKGGPLLAEMPPEGAGPMVAPLVIMLFLGPVEEFGWRGVAQPILQRHMAPVWAGAAIGATWGVWHLPAFYLAGVAYEDWSFLPFFIGNVTLGVLVTPMFNSTKGGLLLPMMFHWQLINPFWPDAQPYDTWILLAVTGAVVIWKRDSLFRRDGAVTEVVPRG